MEVHIEKHHDVHLPPQFAPLLKALTEIYYISPGEVDKMHRNFAPTFTAAELAYTSFEVRLSMPVHVLIVSAKLRAIVFVVRGCVCTSSSLELFA